MFIGLGSGVSLLAGLMMWWEGRKVKKIEGLVSKVVEAKGVGRDGVEASGDGGNKEDKKEEIKRN